ncbi:AEC family transporter [Poseidonocella sedimentorum]|uniref:AEC family transporter n=1 Tax=Poseidonocella sedimentorum TaxID=871652 RepID=UPI000B86D779|nr:AEC family transporter [Poseidonocella sedimentorum]
MIDIFLKTLPFFALIALGFAAVRARIFPQDATIYLTRFVFYFALSAMLFRFTASLSIADIWEPQTAGAYLFGCVIVYALATAVGMARRQGTEVTAVEAQCAVIGNTGFLGVPMLTLLLGPAAIAPILLILSIDLFIFSSLIVILITGSRDGRMSRGVLRTIGVGLLKNPMIVSMACGLSWSASGAPMPVPLDDFVTLLGNAATPGALFAIGASLASKSTERLSVAGWLSFCKLVLHPACVALGALVLFDVDTYDAGVIISAAALPVAGNVFMLAQHYGVAPQRVSASILISTLFSILTVSLVIGWVTML